MNKSVNLFLLDQDSQDILKARLNQIPDDQLQDKRETLLKINTNRTWEVLDKIEKSAQFTLEELLDFVSVKKKVWAATEESIIVASTDVELVIKKAGEALAKFADGESKFNFAEVLKLFKSASDV